MASSLGKRIQYLRTLNNLNQAALAEKAGLSAQHLSRIERDTADPSINSLRSICAALGVELPALFIFSDEIKSGEATANLSACGRQSLFHGVSSGVCTGVISMNPGSGKMHWCENVYRMLGYKPLSINPSPARFVQPLHRHDRDMCRDFLSRSRRVVQGKGITVRCMRSKRERILQLQAGKMDCPHSPVFISVLDITDAAILHGNMLKEKEQLEAYVSRRNNELEALLEQYRREIEFRRRAEQVLKDYELIVSYSLDGLALIDDQGLYKVVNKTYETIMGRTKDQLSGAKFTSALKETLGKKAFEEIVQPRLNRAFQGEQITYQSWFDYPVLGRRYMEIFYVPLMSSGSFTGMVIIVHDLTRQQLAEKAAKQMVEYSYPDWLKTNYR